MNTSDTVLSTNRRSEGHWYFLDTIAMAQNGLLLKLLKVPFKEKSAFLLYPSTRRDLFSSDINYGLSFMKQGSRKLSFTLPALTLQVCIKLR